MNEPSRYAKLLRGLENVQYGEKLTERKKRAPRNKTIILTDEETALFKTRLITLSGSTTFDEVVDKTICQDIFEVLDYLPSQSIELLFAEQANQGADVVYAQPRESVHGNSWRDKSSRAVKTFLAKMLT